MSTPSPAALAAAEEIWNWDELAPPTKEELAEIIDRHTSKPATATRYFTNGRDKWVWTHRMNYVALDGSETGSLFLEPEELLESIDVYETDAYGRKLSPEPEGGEG